MPDDQTRLSWHSSREQWQQVINAAPIPPRREQRDLAWPVPVVAVVVWERDGREEVATTAHGWAGRLAYVRLDDDRVRVRWVWLDAGDVRRV